MIDKPKALSMETMNIEVSCITTSEIHKESTKRIEQRQSISVDSITIDLIRDADEFLLNKLQILLTNAYKPVPYQVRT